MDKPTEQSYIIRCRDCGNTFDDFSLFYNPLIHTCKDQVPLLIAKIPPIPAAKPLPDVFKNTPIGSTLKLDPKPGATLTDLMASARDYLARQSSVTRIEFPKGGYYYVIAKLKERE